MRRFVRMDDFPHGDKRRFTKEKGYTYPDDRKKLKEVLGILESHKVLYVLAASPLLLRDEDIDFLNENVKHGEVCMHGFDHGFSTIEPWPESFGQWHPIWYAGGEFRNMSEQEIDEKYEIGKEILLNINKYNQDEFVLPFDVTTQELINVISRKKEIKRLHSSSDVFNNFRLKRFDFSSVSLIKAQWKSFYDFVKPIVEKIERGVDFKKEQIGLHWIFDTKLPREKWEPYYHRFCELVKNEMGKEIE